MLAEGEAKRWCQRALAEVGRLGGASGQVSLTAARGGHTRFALGEVTQAADTDEVRLEVAVSFGKRRAAASTNQLDAGALAEVVARAARLARLAPESPEVLPPLGAQRYVKVPGAVDDAAARLSAAGRARLVEAALSAARAAKVALAGFLQLARQSTSLADSAGLWAHDERTRLGCSCSARTSDGTGAGWAGAVGARLVEVAPLALAQTAVGKALATAQPRALPVGNYTVVLEPAATASLVRFVTDSLDDRSATEGRSFFSRPGGGARLGERVFPQMVTVRSDPADFAADGRAFDSAGLPQRPTTWIDRGVLARLPCDRAWAARAGKAATGWPEGLAVAGGAATRDELVRGVERGLLVTRFFYLSLVDPMTLQVTGVTRDGVLLIERGQVVGAVRNFRFNHSAAELLRRADGFGPSEAVAIDGGVRLRAPLLRSHDFAMTSLSESV